MEKWKEYLLFLYNKKNKMLGELRAYTFFAFRMVAVATISASADTIRKSADTISASADIIRKSADRLIVFLSAISLFPILILPHLVESMPLLGKQQ